MFTCRDGKGARLVARPQKCYINRSKRHIRNRSTNQIAGNSLFNSEIILVNNSNTYKYIYVIGRLGGPYRGKTVTEVLKM